MATEKTPALENSRFSSENTRTLEGYGLEALGFSLAFERTGLISTLRDQRPLYLISDYEEQPADTKDNVKSVLIDRLSLEQAESELITSLHFMDFTDNVSKSIIENRTRPIVVPIAIGSGENPAWRVGPLWMFYNEGNVGAFREQFRRLRLVQ